MGKGLALLALLLSGCAAENPCEEAHRLRVDNRLILSESDNFSNSCQLLSDKAANCYKVEADTQKLRSKINLELLRQNEKRLTALQQTASLCQ